MAESDRPPTVREGRRGLESVVKLYVSRPGPDAGSREPRGTPPPAETVEESAVRAFDAQSAAEVHRTEDGVAIRSTYGRPETPADRSAESMIEKGSAEIADHFLTAEGRPSRLGSAADWMVSPGWTGDDLPPHNPADDAAPMGEAILPAPRVGGEAQHAEAAFRLEGAWIAARAIADHPEIEIVFEEDFNPVADSRAAASASMATPSTQFGSGTAMAAPGNQPASEAASVAPTDEPAARSAMATPSSQIGSGAAMTAPADPVAPEAARVAPPDEPAARSAMPTPSSQIGSGAAMAAPSARFESETAMGAPLGTRLPAAAGKRKGAGPMPRVVLLIGATPLRLRRMLLEALADPVAAQGRGVLLLESALPLDDATAMLEVALDRGTPITRRNLGVSARDMLLLSPEERQRIFEDLACEEQRADLIVIDLELPESILCPRLQFLVDTIVVALTSNESSLYEAYRALRGLQERRPGMEAFAVPFATTAQEAGFLLERFSVIAQQFLKLPVKDGGWLALASGAGGSEARESSLPRLSEAMAAILKSRPIRDRKRDGFFADEQSSFFEHLRDWFGPATAQ